MEAKTGTGWASIAVAVALWATVLAGVASPLNDWLAAGGLGIGRTPQPVTAEVATLGETSAVR